MSHRRLASLAVASALVLVLGLFLRARLQKTNQAAPAAPPSEAASLQQLSQEGMLRRSATFVSERASSVARYVVYVPQSAASGVRWRADTVLSAGLQRALDVTTRAATDSGTPTIRQLGDSVRSDWMLVVGRAPNGSVLALGGSLGGRARMRCDARDVDELLIGVPLQGQLAGAGVFDINGALVGMVLRCGERLAAIPTGQLAALLAPRDSSARSADALGASLVALDSLTRSYFGTDSGALVMAVRAGSAAQSAGLRPGDILRSIDGTPILAPTDAASAISAEPGEAHRVVRLRGRDRAVIRLPAADSVRSASASQVAPGLGMHLTPDPRPRGIPVGSVQPGSAVHTAGLRTGDRLTRIGSTDVTTRADADRLFRSAPPGAIFIAFERDSMEYGVLVRR